MFIKRIVEDSNKFKRFRNYVLNMQSISVFHDMTKVADFQLINVDVSGTQGVCHVTYTFFGSSLGKA